MMKHCEILLSLSDDGMREFAIKSATPLNMHFSRSLAPTRKQERRHAFTSTVPPLEPIVCTMTFDQLSVTLALYVLRKARISVRDTLSNTLQNKFNLTLQKYPIKISF